MRLIRIATTTAGTFGVLIYKDFPFCVTLENQWKDNEPFISCIPEGLYHCSRVQSPKFGNTFEVNHVEYRTNILFHSGNVEADTQGCILLGNSYGLLYTTPAILNSRTVMSKFLSALNNTNSFPLSIHDRSLHNITSRDNTPLSDAPIG